MNLISLPNELIYVVVELFLDTLGDIVVIRQVCRVLRDVCDGALPSLETEMAVGFNGEDIALAMGNNGPQKIFSPGMVEYRVELEKCGFNYIDITNGNVGLGRRIQPCQISDIDQSGIGFWLLHVRKLNLHGIDSDRHGWSRLIEFFDYLEHKKRTSQLHVTFCEHGLMAYSQGRVVNSPEVRKVVNKINNSSLNLSVDFQISFFENLKQKLYLGPKFSKCVIYYSAIESERLCDVAILLPHHNVSLKIGDQLNPRVQNMQIITEFCGRNIRSLKLAQIEVDANGVLDDLNVDEVIFEGVTWFNRPSNKPTCSASVVKLVTSNLVEFEIFNFTRIKQLHWKSDFDPPLLPAPLHLKKRIMELDLLNVDWYHDLFHESVPYVMLRPIIQHSQMKHLVITTNTDLESFIPTDMDQLETISIIFYHGGMRMTPLEFIHSQTDRLLPRLPSLKLMECYDMPSLTPYIRHRTALNSDNINAKRRKLGLI